MRGGNCYRLTFFGVRRQMLPSTAALRSGDGRTEGILSGADAVGKSSGDWRLPRWSKWLVLIRFTRPSLAGFDR
jgi:hypothetical protein